MNEQHQSYQTAITTYEKLLSSVRDDGHVSYPIIINGNNGSDTPYVNITVVYYNEQLRPCLERIIDFPENDIEVELMFHKKQPGQ